MVVSTAKTEWTINEEGIKIKWLPVFPFLRKPDLEIKWSEIISFYHRSAYQENNRYNNCDRLTLKLNKWRIIEFNFYPKDSNNEFNELLKHIDEKINHQLL